MEQIIIYAAKFKLFSTKLAQKSNFHKIKILIFDSEIMNFHREIQHSDLSQHHEIWLYDHDKSFSILNEISFWGESIRKDWFKRQYLIQSQTSKNWQNWFKNSFSSMVTVLMTMIYFIQYLPFNRCQHCHECRYNYKYFEH